MVLTKMAAPDSATRHGRYVTVLGIRVWNISMSAALDAVMASLKNGSPSVVTFVNAHCVNIACENAAYCRVLNDADYVFADGTGMRLAGRWLGQVFDDNVNGTDMFPLLCDRLNGTHHRVFLLGGRPGVADRVTHWIESRYSGVRVCGTQHGYFPRRESSDVCQRIEEAGADLLLVALGVPDQELWIDWYLERTGVRVAMGVGGLFDFFSGSVRRAPYWMRRLGMEWVYRLWREPGRMWQRYIIGNPLFVWRILRGRTTP